VDRAVLSGYECRNNQNMTTEHIEFHYVCHRCEKKIEASSTQPNTARMVPTKKKFHYVFECKGGCSKDINEVV